MIIQIETPSNQNDFNRVPKISNIPLKMANDNDKNKSLLTYPKFRRNFKDVISNESKFQNQYSRNNNNNNKRRRKE